MPVPDFFTPDAFGLTAMTAAINKQPYKPGFLSSLGIFDEKGVSTNTVYLEQKQGRISILQTQPRYGPRTGRDRIKPKVIPLMIPHIPTFDYIRSDEIQGVREFGTENAPRSMESVRDERLGLMAGDLDLTLEYHRLGAIRGLVLDSDGSTLLDCYATMGVSKPAVVNMDLEAATPASGIVRKRAGGIVRTIKKAVGGAEPSEIMALCGDNYFDDMVAHTEVRDTYKFQDGKTLREGYVFEFVKYGGITWVNYRTDDTGGANKLVHTDYAYAFPIGVKDAFLTRFGPAAFFETVNTVGLPRYAKAVADDWNTQIDVQAETNPLNICTYPDALVSIYKTTGAS